MGIVRRFCLRSCRSCPSQVTSHFLVLRAHPTTVQAVSAPLRIAVEIVNLVLTFLPALGILLGL